MSRQLQGIVPLLLSGLGVDDVKVKTGRSYEMIRLEILRAHARDRLKLKGHLRIAETRCGGEHNEPEDRGSRL